MNKKIFPFPDDLKDREIIRIEQTSELLKRMTRIEENEWRGQIFMYSMRELISLNIKPNFFQLSRIMEQKIKECDELFMKSLNGL